MKGIRRLLTFVTASVALLALPGTAGAATVTNGNFETGTLSGWQTQNTGPDWFAYSGTASPTNALSIAAPPQGSFAAVTDQSSQGTRILYQDVALEPGQTHTLSLYVYYKSNSPIAHPATDSLDYFVVPNQQYRIDVMKPSAPAHLDQPGRHPAADLSNCDRRSHDDGADHDDSRSDPVRRPDGSPPVR